MVFSKEHKKDVAKWIIGLALVSLAAFKDDIVSTFNTGKGVEFTKDVKEAVNDPEIIRSIFSNPETLKQVSIIKKAGEDEMIKRDAEKVGLRVLLGKDMDIREEKVSNELAWTYKFSKFLKLKMDSIIDYRVSKKLDHLIKSKVNLRRL